MGKNLVKMKNWFLEKELYSNEYNLSGRAFEHPKLGKNAYISRTSYFVNAYIEDDVLYYETMNTIYECPLKYINKTIYNDMDEDYIQHCLTCKSTDNVVEQIIYTLATYTKGLAPTEFSQHLLDLIDIGSIELAKLKEQDSIRYLGKASNLKDGSIYIECSTIALGDVLIYNIENEKGFCEPVIEHHMYGDVITYDSDLFVFKYKPQGTNIEVVEWSDNIKEIHLKNIKGYTITFNRKSVLSEELKVFFKGDV